MSAQSIYRRVDRPRSGSPGFTLLNVNLQMTDSSFTVAESPSPHISLAESISNVSAMVSSRFGKHRRAGCSYLLTLRSKAFVGRAAHSPSRGPPWQRCVRRPVWVRRSIRIECLIYVLLQRICLLSGICKVREVDATSDCVRVFLFTYRYHGNGVEARPHVERNLFCRDCIREET